MAAVFGPRPAAAPRELTKLHETVVRGPLDQLAADPALQTPRGEIVVLVGPGAEAAATPADADAALTEALARLGPADAASEVARALGLNRRELYRRAVEMKGRAMVSQTPFPLDGGRAGDGCVCRASGREALMAPAPRRARRPISAATPPPPPLPHRGGGVRAGGAA
ncbi:MAG: hypothetical protein WDM92_15100 [Caulobacteraceae bacterium]